MTHNTMQQIHNAVQSPLWLWHPIFILYSNALNTNKKAEGIWRHLCVAKAFTRWQHRYRPVAKCYVQEFIRKPVMLTCSFSLKFSSLWQWLTPTNVTCGNLFCHNTSMWPTNQSTNISCRSTVSHNICIAAWRHQQQQQTLFFTQ